MSAESKAFHSPVSEIELFRDSFFRETGIFIQNLTRRYIQGSINFGYDSGLDSRHIVPALQHATDFNTSVQFVNWANKWTPQALISINNGEAYIYSSSSGENDDIATIIGNVHIARKVGKFLQNNISTKEALIPNQLIKNSGEKIWIAGRTQEDCFIPSMLRRSLEKLEKEYRIFSNPELEIIKKGHIVTSFFANLDDKCFITAGYDYVDIVGEKDLAKIVSGYLYFDRFDKGKGHLYDMRNYTGNRPWIFMPIKD